MERDDSSSAANSPGRGRTFIGRQREIGQLLEGLEDALSGRGRLFLVAGEPGIGKTRLATEVARQAEARGARVLWGRCWESGGAPAYWPWVQAIRAYLRSEDSGVIRTQLGSGARSLALMMPELRERFSDLPEPLSLGAEGARFQMFDDTARFLLNIAEAQPLLLVLDDIHDADAPSLLLLQFVAGELLTARVLIVALCRNVERDHPLRSASVDILRHQGAQRLSLSGLSEPEIARYIETAIGISMPSGLVSVVHEETEGNPFFVGEVVRLLVNEGRLQQPTDVGLFRLTVPDTVREVIAQRLGQLSEDCVRVLTLASVLGRAFGMNALEKLTLVSRADLLALLDEAVAAHVLAEVPDALGRWRFAHALIRDALYDELRSADRVDLHRKVGEALEELYGDGAELHLAELAHHFFHAAPAADPERAMEYARRAGDRAAGLLAYEEAVRLYRMALQALELSASSEEEARCRLLLAVGDAQARGGDLALAQVTFVQAADSARRSKAPELLAAAALGYGGRFVWARAGGDRRVVPLLEEALGAIGEGDGPIRARLLARLSGALRDRPPRELAARISAQAVEMARRIGDPSTLSYALEGRFAAVYWPENPEERLGIATEIVQVAHESGDVERMAQGHDWRICALMELGELPAAHLEVEAAAARVEQLGQPAQLWLLTFTRAMLALFEGRFDEAESLMRDSLSLGERAQRWEATFTNRIQMFFLRKEQERLDEMEQIIRESIVQYPTRSLFRCIQAHLYWELGRPTETRDAFQALAKHDFSDLLMDNDWLIGLSLLPEVVDFLGGLPTEETLYRLLLPFGDRVAPTAGEASTGSVWRGLGILASAMSRWDAAEKHFEDALVANERMGARPWVAHTRYAYARMLLARDRPGDPERAAALLSAASETCWALGMVALEGRVSALLREWGLATSALVPTDAHISAPSREPSHDPSVFRREGEYWSIAFEGVTFRLKDSKGLRHLAVLLGRPGQEVHAVDLMTATLGRTGPGAAEGRPSELGMHAGLGDAGTVLDDRAKAEYRQRLADLEEELTEAEGWQDAERASRAREEIDFLERELTAAVGLGGRDRRAASEAERGRVNVTKAIRSAMERIREHSPALANHLSATIRRGTFCSYMPDPRVDIHWQI